MAVIQQLSPHVANLIAAGEVVERPSSVVKELMENAIDAGARNITVELVRGGMGMIRVTDDGCGIPADQAATAFLRHATSKISSEDDLTAIGTLGFRGEALAAIAAVSQVELISKTAEEDFGIRLQLDAGTEVSREETGCPEGTTMIVRNLFYNTPARLKFMRKESYEGSVVSTLVQQIAFSHPELSIKLIREGKPVLTTPGDGNMKSALYAVLGRDIALGFIEVKDTLREIQVEGYTTKPTCCKPSRTMEHFFVNGRLVTNRILAAAVEQAYANQKMVGKFPGCVLYLTMPQDWVDVNVHPTKAVVKFQNDSEVFDAVSAAVLAALDRDHTMASFGPSARRAAAPASDTVTANQTQIPLGPAVPISPPGNWVKAVQAQVKGEVPKAPAAPAGTSAASLEFVAPKVPAVSEATAEPRASAVRSRPAAAEPPEVQPQKEEPKTVSPPPAGAVSGWSSGSVFKKSYTQPVPTPQGGFRRVEAIPKPAEGPLVQPKWVRERVGNPCKPDLGSWNPLKEIAQVVKPAAEPAPEPPAVVSAPEETPEPEKPVQPWVVRGEIFRTYVIVEQGDQVIFIDKHAAHERANFDRLKAGDYRPMVQELLMPLTFRPSPVEREILLENLELLKQYGFDLEEYGDAAVAVRAAPDYLEGNEIESALLEVAERIRTTGRGNPENARDELLHSLACKAAIKGGWQTQAAELEAVAELVMSGKVKYCPHGRPVSITLSKSRLEKEFKR